MRYKIEGIHYEQNETCSERVQAGKKCPLPEVSSNLRRIGPNESSSLVAVAGRTICQRARMAIVHQSADGVVAQCHGNSAVPYCGVAEFHIATDRSSKRA